MATPDEPENLHADPMPQHICPPGFARIGRDGVSDIYLVSNEETLMGEAVSFAVSMDDFDPSLVAPHRRETIVLYSTDAIHYIASQADYFSPTAPDWKLKECVMHMIPRSAGWLPVVRACEALLSQTDQGLEAMQRAASKAYLNFVARKARRHHQ